MTKSSTMRSSTVRTRVWMKVKRPLSPLVMRLQMARRVLLDSVVVVVVVVVVQVEHRRVALRLAETSKLLSPKTDTKAAHDARPSCRCLQLVILSAAKDLLLPWLIPYRVDTF